MSGGSEEPHFPLLKLPDVLIDDLRRMNPWWEGKPLPRLPETRRHLVATMRRRLDLGLAPIVVVRGPRQIGKTTAQLHLIDDMLKGGVDPRRIMRVQFDELPSLADLKQPVLEIVSWYEQVVLRSTLNEAARSDAPAVLMLDEVQNLSRWAEQLKHLVDSSTVQAVVTGSSALRIEHGRDSLAGRINTIDAGVLSLTEIGDFHGLDLGEPYLHDNGVDPLIDHAFWTGLAEHGRERSAPRDKAFAWFSQRGGYPLAHKRADVEWGYIADQLNETVIKRVIQHDLRIGEKGRKRDAALLEELFRLCCRYAGQSPDTQTLARELQRVMNANVGGERVKAYMRFLHETLLIRLIDPLEIRLKRGRGNPKICLADHALRASWLQEVVPIDPEGLRAEPELTPLAGRLAESVTGAVLSTVPQIDLAWFPERSGEPEIDLVMTIGTRRIPIEVKYQRRIDPLGDTEGLRTFMEKAANNAPFALLITQADDEIPALDPRIVAMPLSSLMLLR
ncbi:MAG: ATP-binding protein [Phycisphaerales bacterium]|nr:MAG: ATP-binding protein [Phycisphaerales bacterium]